MTIEIEKVSNGYIYKDSHHPKEVMQTTDELFDRILLACEGRWKHFSGDMYGKVRIDREKNTPALIITGNLINAIACEQFRQCNTGELDDVSEYVKGMWIDGAVESLEEFNDVVGILNTLKEPKSI